MFFFSVFVFPFKAPGLRLSPQVWLAFCMASISIYCHNNNNNNNNNNNLFLLCVFHSKMLTNIT